METVFLKKGEDRRLRAGHLWVFSNEIDVKRSPLVSFTPMLYSLVMRLRVSSMAVLMSSAIMTRSQAPRAMSQVVTGF